jgi:hypothetical protein
MEGLRAGIDRYLKAMEVRADVGSKDRHLKAMQGVLSAVGSKDCFLEITEGSQGGRVDHREVKADVGSKVRHLMAMEGVMVAVGSKGSLLEILEGGRAAV